MTKEIYFQNINTGKSYMLELTDANFERLMDMFSDLEGDEQPLNDEDVFMLCESYQEIDPKIMDDIINGAVEPDLDTFSEN